MYTGGGDIGREPDVYFNYRSCGVGTVISGNTFMDNRNNALTLQTVGALVENNRIENVSIAMRGGGFLSWKEGPPPYNLTIRDNTVRDCASAVQSGYQLKSRENAACRPVRDLRVTGNQFVDCGSALNLDNVDGLEINRNVQNNRAPWRFGNLGGIVLGDNEIEKRRLAKTDIRIGERCGAFAVGQ